MLVELLTQNQMILLKPCCVSEHSAWIKTAETGNARVLTLTQKIYFPLYVEKLNVFLEKDTCIIRRGYSKEK